MMDQELELLFFQRLSNRSIRVRRRWYLFRWNRKRNISRYRFLWWIWRRYNHIWKRIPIIPGFNNSLEDTKKFVKLIKNLGIEEVNLLPFHNLGENKYRLLNRKYEYKNGSLLYFSYSFDNCFLFLLQYVP